MSGFSGKVKEIYKEGLEIVIKKYFAFLMVLFDSWASFQMGLTEMSSKWFQTDGDGGWKYVKEQQTCQDLVCADGEILIERNAFSKLMYL